MRHWIIGLLAIAWTGLVLAAAPAKVVLDVKNVTCPACRISIEKSLDRTTGVVGRVVDTQKATVTVTYEPNQTSVSALEKTITAAGFPAKARKNGG